MFVFDQLAKLGRAVLCGRPQTGAEAPLSKCVVMYKTTSAHARSHNIASNCHAVLDQVCFDVFQVSNIIPLASLLCS